LYVFEDGVSSDDSIRKIDLASLSVSWTRTFEAEAVAPLFGEGNSFESRPISVGSGRVYFGARDAYIYGLDAATGRTKVKVYVPQGGSVDQIPPFGFERLLIISDLYVIAYRT